MWVSEGLLSSSSCNRWPRCSACSSCCWSCRNCSLGTTAQPCCGSSQGCRGWLSIPLLLERRICRATRQAVRGEQHGALLEVCVWSCSCMTHNALSLKHLLCTREASLKPETDAKTNSSQWKRCTFTCSSAKSIGD